MTAYICIGSNINDPAAQISSALEMLSKLPAVNVLRKSSVQETPAWGYTEQPDFLNQVVELECKDTPIELLQALKNIEHEMGRCETFRWGPRLIDLDIILYEDWIVETRELTIPHPDLAKRLFVLQLLNELIPDYTHPKLNKNINTLLQELLSVGGYE